MEPIRILLVAESEPEASMLPDGLRTLYDGDLRFPVFTSKAPYVIANFVSTLDGVVSFNMPGESGGAQISGSNDGDRFIMGLLRASADAVMVGASTGRGGQPRWPVDRGIRLSACQGSLQRLPQNCLEETRAPPRRSRQRKR